MKKHANEDGKRESSIVKRQTWIVKKVAALKTFLHLDR
jgi:hypothetical protein